MVPADTAPAAGSGAPAASTAALSSVSPSSSQLTSVPSAAWSSSVSRPASWSCSKVPVGTPSGPLPGPADTGQTTATLVGFVPVMSQGRNVRAVPNLVRAPVVGSSAITSTAIG